MNRYRKTLGAIGIILLFCSGSYGADIDEAATARNGDEASWISLAGEDWTFAMDPKDKGEEAGWGNQSFEHSFRLPGSMAENGLGDPPSLDTKWTGGIVDRSFFTEPRYEKYRQADNFKVPFWLTPTLYYAGSAWYQKDFVIPPAARGKRVFLFLERCHWETTVWLDGKKVGMQNSLATPHEYALGSVPTGRHRLVIRVDNRVKDIDPGENAHSISDHTQSNWNGIIGKIGLKFLSPVRIDDAQIYPDLSENRVRVHLKIINDLSETISGTVALSCSAEKQPTTLQMTLKPGVSFQDVFLDVKEGVKTWDEFSPETYDLHINVSNSEQDIHSSTTISFGLRDFRATGRSFTINDRPVFLRGTLECAIFPLTGHPPMDVPAWQRIMQILKSHGLNHLRFHSWCPPEAAFSAADAEGVYLQIECCAWARIGDGAPIDAFIYDEGDRILKAYGNHPSFVLMAYGNEPSGQNHKAYLGKLLETWKSKDARRLYTSAAGWPSIAENQYHSTPDPRIQQWGQQLNSRINALPPETTTDYRGFISRFEVPVVSHEIGQWCVYPNFYEISKYTGVLQARNFEIFRDFLAENHMLDQAHDFLMASGKLQTLCYKEDIESALRTPGFGGFQLLDLHDFPGQGTALVGVLDPFWDSKPYVTPSEYKRFSGPIVPLARLAKRIWTASETFEAQIEIANFGPGVIANPRPVWTLADNNGRVASSGKLKTDDIPNGNSMDLGRISLPLEKLAIQLPAKLVLSVALEGTDVANDWDVWVFPDQVSTQPPKDILIASSLDEEARATLASGGRVLLLPAKGAVAGDERGKVPPGFSSIFWNTAWTRGQAPHTLGILCDPKHPLMGDFPTEYHSNWQWWELISGSQIMILDDLPQALRPVVQIIDDWFSARKLGLIVEARVGKGRLVICGADLVNQLEKRPVARQMRHSILRYMQSDSFRPLHEVSFAELQTLFVEPSPMEKIGIASVQADSFMPEYPVNNILDGDVKTFWHTPWGDDAPGFPHECTVEFKQALPIAGFIYTPRQDMQNGWIRGYEFYVSTDGKDWGEPIASGEFQTGINAKEIKFKQPVKGQFIRLRALSGHRNDPFATISELQVIVRKE